MNAPHITETTKYNTLNAWGFGGSYGTQIRFSDGWILRKGLACYRHLPSHRIAYAIGPERTQTKTRSAGPDTCTVEVRECPRYLDLQEEKTRPAVIPEHVWAHV